MSKRSYFLFFVILLSLFSVSYGQNQVQSDFSISPLSPALQQKIILTKLWSAGCPVPLDDLRLVTVKYYDFEGKTHTDGEIILNKSVAPAAVQVFEKLYADKFPLALVDTLIRFNANWHLAEKENTTYGFICNKNVDNTFSQESYGTVITINPVQNPQIALLQEKKAQSNFWCKILHPIHSCDNDIKIPKIMIFPSTGMLSINRSLRIKGMNETIAPIFKQHGFSWSGLKTDDISWKKFIYNLSESNQ